MGQVQSLRKREYRRKLAIVGDMFAGKTTLLRSVTRGSFVDVMYAPMVVENYVVDILVEKRLVSLALWDTMNQEDFDRLRPLVYSGANIVLMAFSIDNPESLANLQDKWIGEVRHFCPGIPIILVGLKKDLRDDPGTLAELEKQGQHPVTVDEAEKVREALGVFRYMECSSKTFDGVPELFRVAAAASLSIRVKK